MAILAARLREDSARLRSMLGADTLKETDGEINSWFLEQTPEGQEFSDFLIREFQNYQAAVQAVGQAA
ncbi:MAG: hypothetical protein WC352_05630 [Candidatus Omnitrophota bacterium]